MIFEASSMWTPPPYEWMEILGGWLERRLLTNYSLRWTFLKNCYHGTKAIALETLIRGSYYFAKRCQFRARARREWKKSEGVIVSKAQRENREAMMKNNVTACQLWHG